MLVGASLRMDAQRRAVALTVIGLVEAVEGRPVHAEQQTLPVRRLEAIQVDQQTHDAIAEAMAHRFQARMHHLAKVKRSRGVLCIAIGFGFGGWLAHRYSAACANSGGGARHGTAAPSASATARPDRNPSS